MPTTSNFGWTTPADTDLVKDGAAAIRTLGNGIDTSLVDLKGGTTGQVLSKASNTDLDFTWSSVDPLTILDAKGDLISATAADTPARLASSGVNGDVLTVDTTTATGLKWAASAGGGTSWTLLNSGGTDLTGATTITVSGISAKNKLMVIIDGASSVNNGFGCNLRLNSDSSANYKAYGGRILNNSTDGENTRLSTVEEDGATEFILGSDSQASKAFNGAVFIDGANTSGIKSFQAHGAGDFSATNSGSTGIFQGGYWDNNATVTSVSVISSSGNFDAGKIWVYTSTN